jgi:hypothetical protein
MTFRSLLLRANNLPNTLVGLGLGVLGLPFGARMRIVDGVAEVLTHPFILRRAAITLGQVVLYGAGATPSSVGFDGNRLGDHERAHVRQGERLGIFYLPAHLLSGLAGMILDRDWYGPANWNERGPQRHPPLPW